MTVNVLVFPCGSEIGLEIHAALRHAKDICLHGASSVSDHGEFVYARYRQIAAQAGSAELVPQLNALIDAWDIDLVVPAHDSVIPVLADNQQQLHAPAMVPDPAIAAICRNKNRTYARLQHLGIVPRANSSSQSDVGWVTGTGGAIHWAPGPEKIDGACEGQSRSGTAKAVVASGVVTVHASTLLASSQEPAVPGRF